MKLTKEMKIEVIRRVARHFWVKACQHDLIPTDSKFVIFDSRNRYAKLHNRAMGVYFLLTAGKPEVAKMGFAGVR